MTEFLSERLRAAAAKVPDCDYPFIDLEEEAREILAAADAVMFAPARMAEIVRRTGLSLHTVTEVARELRDA